ncbi:MAG: Fe-S-binding domain-containing protein, partial [Elusimicrobia bacterium CG_4_10_14_0_2_um_filter_56_8]
ENKVLPDLCLREWLYLAPILVFIVLIGVWPNPFLKRALPAVNNYIALSQQRTAPSPAEVKIVLGGEKNE